MKRYRIMLGLSAIIMAGSLALAQDPGPPDLNRAYRHGTGTYLVDAEGHTLYIRATDEDGTSSCYDDCATNWPPALADGTPVAGNGLDGSLLGVTERDDGTSQLTYAGRPLYRFASDAASGDVTGQARGNVWFLVGADGNPIGAPFGTFGSSDGALLDRAYKHGIGTYLIDAAGRSIYAFTDDDGSSNCSGDCAAAWPPLTVDGEGALGSGLDAGLAGTTTRDDGSMQLTYAGHPLYLFVNDAASGDVAGQGLNDKWYLIAPDGSLIRTAAEAQAEAPAEEEAPEEADAPAEAEAPEAEAAEEPAEAEAEAPGIPAEVMVQGAAIYSTHCASCHGAEGEGGVGPTLIDSSLLASSDRAIRLVINGGHIMPPFGSLLDDEQIANVLTYARNTWGNEFGPVTADEVAAQR